VKRKERRVAPLPDHPPPPSEPFEAPVVTLYRSTLRPQGALYDPLARTLPVDAGDSPPEPPAH
jgi:2'-5' RNA ligase